MMSPLSSPVLSQDLTPMPDLSPGQCGKLHSLQSEFRYKKERNSGKGKPFSNRRQTKGDQCRLQGILQHLKLIIIETARTETKAFGHLGLNFSKRFIKLFQERKFSLNTLKQSQSVCFGIFCLYVAMVFRTFQ